MSEEIRPSTPALLTEREAAERLRLAAKTLRSWRSEGRGPLYRKFGRSVRYTVSDLTAFVERCAFGSTVSYGRRAPADANDGR